jgi:hypothetical protein
VRRIGKLKALVAIARSILVIVWHLLADPTARFHDLGAGYYTGHINKDRKDPQPRPPAPGAGLQRHPDAGRLTRAGAVAFAATAVEQRDWPHENAPSSSCSGSTV